MITMVHNGHPIKICPVDDQYDLPDAWKFDTVFIYNKAKVLSQKQITAIMDYRFAEGFIRHRKTKYYVAHYTREDEIDFL